MFREGSIQWDTKQKEFFIFTKDYYQMISPKTLVKDFSQELSQLQTNYILNTI